MDKKEVDKRKKEESTKKYQESLGKNKEVILAAPDSNIEDSFEDRIKAVKENEIGYFNLIQNGEKGNTDEESVKLLVPYLWQKNETDAENIEMIEQQKRKYEETFNALDREAQQMSIDAAFRAGNFANNLETGVENVLEDQTKKEYAYDRLIEMTELWMEYENYRLDKLAEDAEKAQLTVLGKMGALALKADEIQDIITSSDEPGELDVEKLADKLEADLAEQCLIYAPAMYSLEDKVSANKYQNIDEYLLDLKKEVLLNRFEALNMLFVIEIGTALILRSNGSFFSSAIGTAIIASAPSIGRVARNKAKDFLAGEEMDYTLRDIMGELREEFEEFFDLSNYLGQKNIILKFGLEAEEEMIAEFAIDGPSAWESVKIITPNLIALIEEESVIRNFMFAAIGTNFIKKVGSKIPIYFFYKWMFSTGLNMLSHLANSKHYSILYGSKFKAAYREDRVEKEYKFDSSIMPMDYAGMTFLVPGSTKTYSRHLESTGKEKIFIEANGVLKNIAEADFRAFNKQNNNQEDIKRQRYIAEINGVEFLADYLTDEAILLIQDGTPNNSCNIQIRQFVNGDYGINLAGLKEEELSLLTTDESGEDLYKIFDFDKEEVKMPIKLKEFSAYYGSVKAIGEVINLEKEQGIERDFVAFFSSDAIKEVADNLFGKDNQADFDINASQLAEFKEIKYSNKLERFIYKTTNNQDIKNKIVYDYDKRNNQGVTPLPYLKKIEQHFSKDYLEKRIREGIQFINAGNFSILHSNCDFRNDTYFIRDISIIDDFARAYGVNIKEDNISYEKILNASYNSFIKAKNFINLDYNYIVESEIRAANHGLEFFRDKTENLVGSKADEEYNEAIETFEFWTGLGCVNQYKASNPKAEIKINNYLIGQNLERVFSNDDSSTYITKVRRYEESFKAGDRVLQLRYLYQLPKWLKLGRKPDLEIKYRYKSSSQWREDNWNKIIIQDFDSDSCDYGIRLPDKVDCLAGSGCHEENKEINEERVELESNKIKLNDEYLNPEQITPLADDTQLVYQVKQGDKLWSIARDFLGDKKQWQKLLKKDGSTYTKEEAKEIKAGDEVIIPFADDNRGKIFADEVERKYVKDDKGNLFIYCSLGEETETLAIVGFSEGDYGLWIEKEPPYYLSGDELINRSGRKKADKAEVLDLEENQWLEEEERIKEDKIWLYGGEKIEFPTECEDVGEKELLAYGVSAATAEASNGDNGSDSEDNLAEEKLDDNEIEGNDGEDGSSGDELFVCAGAELQCNFGDDEADLKVMAGHNIKIDGELMANMMDNKPFVNVGPFGQCSNLANPMVAAATAANAGRLQEMPCIPVIPAPWLKTKMDVRVSKLPALLESSQLMCVYGGLITIEDAGQNFVKEL